MGSIPFGVRLRMFSVLLVRFGVVYNRWVRVRLISVRDQVLGLVKFQFGSGLLKGMTYMWL